jgi:DNA-binding IscR family transcriptional regulator
MSGALAPVKCASEYFYERCTCPNEARCPIREVMKEAQEAVASIMERTTLADLCQRARILETEQPEPPDYII